MADFKDLREFVDRKHLDLPIDGTTWRIGDVDGETGIWALRIVELGQAAKRGEKVEGADLDDDAERQMYGRLLGDTLGKMLAEGVDWSDIKCAAVTTLAWVVGGEDAALKVWEAGGDPEALPPSPATGNRNSRRASAAVARKTKPRASTSGTRATKTRAAGGKKSSSSGR